MAKTIARLMIETDDTDQSIIDIYVAIQSREFVQALQLSRHPSISSTPLAQALGALALSYIGRRAEAIGGSRLWVTHIRSHPRAAPKRASCRPRP